MINKEIILKVIGSLLLLESAMMIVCLAVAIYCGGDDAMAFLISSISTVCGGLLLKYWGRSGTNNMGRRDAYLVVALAWAVFSLFGMQPLLFSGYVTNIADAYFETMSGFTTTGASIINNVERLPHGLLFWRSLTQWIGGLGIVFFTIAILPSMVEGNVKVFAAEATGPIKTKLHPRLGTTAKWIWGGYTALTLACFAAYYFSGMSLFDGANYAMTTTATGGFAPHNDSLLHFNSPLIEYESIFFQFAGGVNFTLLYLALFKFKFREFFHNSELRFFLCMLLVATAIIMSMLMARCGYEWERALRSALFTVVSFSTTTGLFNDSIAAWPHLTWIVLAIMMFVGACAGSTSGGFKCVRVVMIFKVMRNEFRHIIHPNAVLPVKLNGHSLPSSNIPTLLAFLALFVSVLFLSTAFCIVMGIDMINAANISLSCLSNVGPTLGVGVGPDLSWVELPTVVKWLCSVLMLTGRLEIFSVLVIFTRSFWKDN